VPVPHLSLNSLTGQPESEFEAIVHPRLRKTLTPYSCSDNVRKIFGQGL